MFLFPFQQIEAGSRIIIYGLGYVGKEYWRQIQKNSYCECVCFIDQNAELWKDYPFPVYTKEYLSQDIQYDYIVIAAERISTGKKIEEILLEYGVPEEKIVCPAKNGIDVKVICENSVLQKLTNDFSIIHDLLAGFKENAYGNIEYFQPLVDELRNAEDKDEIVAKFISEMDKEKLSCVDEIILITILRKASIVRPALLKRFMNNLDALPVEHRDDLYVLLCDVGHWIMNHPEGIYDEFFCERKKLMQKVCSLYELSVKKDYICEEKKEIKRIAIIVYQYSLTEKLIAIDGIACQTANEMANKGYDVCIIPLSVFENWDVDLLIKPMGFTLHSSLLGKMWNRHFTDEKVMIKYRYENSIYGRLQGCINDIVSFQPDVILDMADAMFMPSALLYKKIPILFYPTRSNALDTFFTKSITFNKEQTKKYNERYKYISEQQLIETKGVGHSGNYLSAVVETEYTREQFGLEENDFIVVTSGARLSGDLKDDLGIEMKWLLEKYSDIKWLIVGERPGLTDFKYEKLLQEKRIIYWGFENELKALFEICDVYLYPKRLGAGLSTRIAMQCGLPIAILDYPSDGLEAVGAENVIKGDYYEEVQHIEELHNDKTFYNERSRIMKERIEELYSVDANQELIDALKICYDYFYCEEA